MWKCLPNDCLDCLEDARFHQVHRACCIPSSSVWPQSATTLRWLTIILLADSYWLYTQFKCITSCGFLFFFCNVFFSLLSVVFCTSFPEKGDIGRFVKNCREHHVSLRLELSLIPWKCWQTGRQVLGKPAVHVCLLFYTLTLDKKYPVKKGPILRMLVTTDSQLICFMITIKGYVSFAKYFFISGVNSRHNIKYTNWHRLSLALNITSFTHSFLQETD